MKKIDKQVLAAEKLNILGLPFHFANYASIFVSFLSLLILALIGFLGYKSYDLIIEVKDYLKDFSNNIGNSIGLLIILFLILIAIIILFIFSIKNFKASLVFKNLYKYRPSKQYIFSKYIGTYLGLYIGMIFISLICFGLMFAYMENRNYSIIPVCAIIYFIFPVVFFIIELRKIKKGYKNVTFNKQKEIVYDKY